MGGTSDAISLSRARASRARLLAPSPARAYHGARRWRRVIDHHATRGPKKRVDAKKKKRRKEEEKKKKNTSGNCVKSGVELTWTPSRRHAVTASRSPFGHALRRAGACHARVAEWWWRARQSERRDHSASSVEAAESGLFRARVSLSPARGVIAAAGRRSRVIGVRPRALAHARRHERRARADDEGGSSTSVVVMPVASSLLLLAPRGDRGGWWRPATTSTTSERASEPPPPSRYLLSCESSPSVASFAASLPSSTPNSAPSLPMNWYSPARLIGTEPAQ